MASSLGLFPSATRTPQHWYRSTGITPRQRTQLVVYSRTSVDPSSQPQPPPPPPPPFPSPQKQVGGGARRSLLLLFGGGLLGAAGNNAVRQLFNPSSKVGGSDGLTYEQIDKRRLEFGFRRDYDGTVYLLSRGTGKWYQVKADALIPGTLLLRDPDNFVYFISFNNVQQIDLSDDEAISALVGDGAWEGALQPVPGRDDVGNIADVVMDEETFRTIISLQLMEA